MRNGKGDKQRPRQVSREQYERNFDEWISNRNEKEPEFSLDFVRHTLREANELRNEEWDSDSQVTLSFRGNELAGEVGEACNLIKKLERERMGLVGSRTTKEKLAKELADVVICIDLIAMQEDIDLNKAVEDKFNHTSKKYGLTTRLRF